MKECVLVSVRVKAGCKRAYVGGEYQGSSGSALVVAVREVAVEGKASKAVGEALAKAMGVRNADVVLKCGAMSKDKVFSVSGKRSFSNFSWTSY